LRVCVCVWAREGATKQGWQAKACQGTNIWTWLCVSYAFLGAHKHLASRLHLWIPLTYVWHLMQTLMMLSRMKSRRCRCRCVAIAGSTMIDRHAPKTSTFLHMLAHTHTHSHTHTHTYIHTHLHAHIHICTKTITYLQMLAHTHIHTHLHAHIHICTHCCILIRTGRLLQWNAAPTHCLHL